VGAAFAAHGLVSIGRHLKSGSQAPPAEKLAEPEKGGPS